MRTIFTLALILGLSGASFTQVDTEPQNKEKDPVEDMKPAPKDTTRFKMGKTEVIIIDAEEDNEFDDDFKEEDFEEPKKRKSEPHWAGLDFGFSMLMNNNFESNFPNHPYWRNDPAKSQVWNLNLIEHKFNIAKEYVGITTGLGFSFTSVAFRDNYTLSANADTVFATIDTVYAYSKNKLRATYLTVPLLLEFNTNRDPDKSFYLATGLIGGVRIGSKVKQVGEYDGREFKIKEKGVYGLNAFKLDATARLGYNSFGVFANYSLLPLFQEGKTVDIHPLIFGLTLNF